MSIQLKISTVPGKVPVAADLIHGELAMNSVDGKLYTKNSAETVFRLLTTIDRRPGVRVAGATDDSVVTETGIRAAIDSAVSGITGPWAVSGANIYNTNAGNVGIGINAPTEKLHLYGSTYNLFIDRPALTNRAYLTIGTAGVKQWFLGQPDSDLFGNGTEFFIGTTFAAPRLLINAAGNVGIGASSPLGKLDLNNGIFARHNSSWTGIDNSVIIPTQNILAYATKNPYFTISVSSNPSNGAAALANLFDDSSSTDARWSSTSFPVTIEISWADRKNLNGLFGIGFYGSTYTANTIKIEAYDDNASNWVTIIDTTSNATDSVSIYKYQNYVTKLRYTISDSVKTSIRVVGLLFGNSSDRRGYYFRKGGDELYGQLSSLVATGTAPFSIASITLNTNLNADLLDGYHASAFLLNGSIQPHVAGLGLAGDSFNGSASVTWAVDFAGTGDSNFVARSNHNHDDQYAAFGHNHFIVSLADVLIDTLANGQVLMYNSTLDVWENGNAGGYWKRVGTIISPDIAGDTVNATATGTAHAIYGACTGAVNSVGVRGTSDMGFGTYGTSVTSHGAVGTSTSGNGGYFNSGSGTGVSGSSTSGKGGVFSSYSNIPLEVSVQSADTSLLYNMINIMRNTSGTAANGIGAIINFNIEDSTGGSSPSVQLAAELTNVSPVSSDFSVKLRNAGASATEVFRLKGNGDMYSYANSFHTKAGGSVTRLRSYHDTAGVAGFLKNGDYLGSLTFDAWSSASTYASVAGIIATATADHDSTNYASKLEFWLMAASSSVPRQVGEFTPAGKLKGVFGFAVPGADGISGTSTIVTGVSYDSGTMTLTFTRATLTVSGGIVTNVAAESNTIIPLSP